VHRAALIGDLLADSAGTTPLCDDFVTKRQKFNQMPPPTVTVCWSRHREDDTEGRYKVPIRTEE